ncbi:MAG: hypothetical protein LBJ46_03095 [Planctomycetota bacterium]|jgi:xylulokinase|nr:hypothetical protein [Planctomycetota bacterium]
MRYIISLDLGTSAFKVALFDEDGKIIASSNQEYALVTPDTLSVELDVDTYWRAFKAGLAEVLAASKVDVGDIKAFGLSAQGETLILLDKHGKVLRNAIIWMDNRAQDEAGELDKRFPREVSAKISGQVSIVPTWPAAKILWVARHEPDIFRKTAKFLLIEDYFIYRLTGKFVAEGSLLCSTLYWDINTKKYWKDMLDCLGIDESRLPEIRESGEVVGPLLPEVAGELGLSPDTLVSTGVLDQAAGAIGVGNIVNGVFSECTGSALAICATVEHSFVDRAGRMPCHYHGIPDVYMAHTFTTGGMVMKWFRDAFCDPEMCAGESSGLDPYRLMDMAAKRVAPGSDGLVMLPHLQGAMAPEANGKAKGVFYGITLRHARGHFIRAVMESVGFIVLRNIDALEDMGVKVGEIRALGGGAKSPIWNQIKADITGRTVVVTESDEAACLGAAVVAGVGAGVFDSLKNACDRMVKVKSRYEPDPANRDVYGETYRKYIDLYEAVRPIYERG